MLSDTNVIVDAKLGDLWTAFDRMQRSVMAVQTTRSEFMLLSEEQRTGLYDWVSERLAKSSRKNFRILRSKNDVDRIQ